MYLEGTGWINMYGNIFVFILLLAVSLYLNEWWLWVLFGLNTLSDWVIVPYRKRRKEK